MAYDSVLQTKILVYDSNPAVLENLKRLSGAEGINIYQPIEFDILEFLANPNIINTDVGAVFLTDEMDENGLSGFHIAKKIYQQRIALPLFLRMTNSEQNNLAQIDEGHYFSGAYSLNSAGSLEALLRYYLFSAQYPLEFVKKFQQIGLEVLSSMISGIHLEAATPFLVKDFLLTNNISSLMPVTLSCGKGYVLIQALHQCIEFIFKNGYCTFNTSQYNQTDFDQFLSECVNLMCGRLKSYFARDLDFLNLTDYSQIPVVINNQRNDVSFGSTRPQLCLRYYLNHNSKIEPECNYIDIKLVFNVRWSNVEMHNNVQASGNLELL